MDNRSDSLLIQNLYSIFGVEDKRRKGKGLEYEINYPEPVVLPSLESMVRDSYSAYILSNPNKYRIEYEDKSILYDKDKEKINLLNIIESKLIKEYNQINKSNLESIIKIPYENNILDPINSLKISSDYGSIYTDYMLGNSLHVSHEHGKRTQTIVALTQDVAELLSPSHYFNWEGILSPSDAAIAQLCYIAQLCALGLIPTSISSRDYLHRGEKPFFRQTPAQESFANALRNPAAFSRAGNRTVINIANSSNWYDSPGSVKSYQEQESAHADIDESYERSALEKIVGKHRLLLGGNFVYEFGPGDGKKFLDFSKWVGSKKGGFCDSSIFYASLAAQTIKTAGYTPYAHRVDLESGNERKELADFMSHVRDRVTYLMLGRTLGNFVDDRGFVDYVYDMMKDGDSVIFGIELDGSSPSELEDRYQKAEAFMRTNFMRMLPSGNQAAEAVMQEYFGEYKAHYRNGRIEATIDAKKSFGITAETGEIVELDGKAIEIGQEVIPVEKGTEFVVGVSKKYRLEDIQTTFIRNDIILMPEIIFDTAGKPVYACVMALKIPQKYYIQ